MNWAQLIEAAAKDAGVAPVKVEDVLRVAFGKVVEAVMSGEAVELRGFGRFVSVKRAQRVGRNPRTGDALTIPATTVPQFRPGPAFREAVAGRANPQVRQPVKLSIER